MNRSRITPNIDTTKIGSIQIRLNLTGSVVDKDIQFVPAMINPSIKGVNVYFPITVPLSNSAIRKALPSNPDPIFVLTRLSDYLKFMYYATDPYRHTPVELGTKTATDIITGNIKYVVDSLFKNYIQINGRNYQIRSKKVDDPKTYPKKKDEPLVIKITITLDLIDKDKDTFYGNIKLNCSKKREEINETYKQLFERLFFPRRGEDIKSGISDRMPTMYSNVEQGTTTGDAQYRGRDYDPRYKGRDYGPLYKGRDYDPLYKGRDYDPLYKGRDYDPRYVRPTFSAPTYPRQSAPTGTRIQSAGMTKKLHPRAHSLTRKTSRRKPYTSSTGIRSKSTRR
jgi:hypothetical protein